MQGSQMWPCFWSFSRSLTQFPLHVFQANIFSPFELSSLLYWKIVKKHLVDAEKNICKMKLVMIEEKVEFR